MTTLLCFCFAIMPVPTFVRCVGVKYCYYMEIQQQRKKKFLTCIKPGLPSLFRLMSSFLRYLFVTRLSAISLTPSTVNWQLAHTNSSKMQPADPKVSFQAFTTSACMCYSEPTQLLFELMYVFEITSLNSGEPDKSMYRSLLEAFKTPARDINKVWIDII